MNTLKVREKDGGVTIECRVTPRAGRTAIKGVRDGVLQVALAAPPVEGAANKALIAFFAEFLHIPRSRISLVSGERRRTKVLFIRGVTAPQLLSAV